eukprot:TRINITY_DN8452_c0_g1_i3.p1 TRINITY_DN8452_c0_g1~~TRINITY_DN8452_c0_g1_i3.p1  ORF type:complete len:1372 (-),score=308.46 TRINITY_DN8452_c0_g1_i3:67-4182(-)
MDGEASGDDQKAQQSSSSEGILGRLRQSQVEPQLRQAILAERSEIPAIDFGSLSLRAQTEQTTQAQSIISKLRQPATESDHGGQLSEGARCALGFSDVMFEDNETDQQPSARKVELPVQPAPQTLSSPAPLQGGFLAQWNSIVTAVLPGACTPRSPVAGSRSSEERSPGQELQTDAGRSEGSSSSSAPRKPAGVSNMDLTEPQPSEPPPRSRLSQAASVESFFVQICDALVSCAAGKPVEGLQGEAAEAFRDLTEALVRRARRNLGQVTESSSELPALAADSIELLSHLMAKDSHPSDVTAAGTRSAELSGSAPMTQKAVSSIFTRISRGLRESASEGGASGQRLHVTNFLAKAFSEAALQLQFNPSQEMQAHTPNSSSSAGGSEPQSDMLLTKALVNAARCAEMMDAALLTVSQQHPLPSVSSLLTQSSTPSEESASWAEGTAQLLQELYCQAALEMSAASRAATTSQLPPPLPLPLGPLPRSEAGDDMDAVSDSLAFSVTEGTFGTFYSDISAFQRSKTGRKFSAELSQLPSPFVTATKLPAVGESVTSLEGAAREGEADQAVKDVLRAQLRHRLAEAAIDGRLQMELSRFTPQHDAVTKKQAGPAKACVPLRIALGKAALDGSLLEELMALPEEEFEAPERLDGPLVQEDASPIHSKAANAGEELSGRADELPSERSEDPNVAAEPQLPADNDVQSAEHAFDEHDVNRDVEPRAELIKSELTNAEPVIGEPVASLPAESEHVGREHAAAELAVAVSVHVAIEHAVEPVPCEQVDVEPVVSTSAEAAPVVSEQAETEPAVGEPSTAVPVACELAAESVISDPVDAEPAVRLLTAAEIVVSEHAEKEPTVNVPPATEPVTTEPAAAEPTVIAPAVAEPVLNEHAGVETVASESASAEPLVIEHAATQPVASIPAESEPVLREHTDEELVAVEPPEDDPTGHGWASPSIGSPSSVRSYTDKDPHTPGCLLILPAPEPDQCFEEDGIKGKAMAEYRIRLAQRRQARQILRQWRRMAAVASAVRRKRAETEEMDLQLQQSTGNVFAQGPRRALPAQDDDLRRELKKAARKKAPELGMLQVSRPWDSEDSAANRADMLLNYLDNLGKGDGAEAIEKCLYADGLKPSRAIQRKISQAPGPVPQREPQVPVEAVQVEESEDRRQQALPPSRKESLHQVYRPQVKNSLLPRIPLSPRAKSRREKGSKKKQVASASAPELPRLPPVAPAAPAPHSPAVAKGKADAEQSSNRRAPSDESSARRFTNLVVQGSVAEPEDPPEAAAYPKPSKAPQSPKGQKASPYNGAFLPQLAPVKRGALLDNAKESRGAVGIYAPSYKKVSADVAEKRRLQRASASLPALPVKQKAPAAEALPRNWRPL